MRFAYVLLGLSSLTYLHTSSGTPPNAAHGTIAAQADDVYIEEPCGGDISGWPNGNVCCNAWCRVCEEEGCRRRGLREDFCCPSIIQEDRVRCSVRGYGPCVLDDGFCSNNIPGVESEDGVCCAYKCGACGGPGCEDRPGGEDECCSERVMDFARYCSDHPFAPCIMDGPLLDSVSEN